MSYSYITKVFPKFQYSNVYDSNLYNNISGLNKDNIPLDSSKNLDIQNVQDKHEEYISPVNTNLETYKNIELSQDNQKYYNKSLPVGLINEDNSNILNKNINLISKDELKDRYSSNISNRIPTSQNELDLHTESFSNSDNHSDYTKHILECEHCKNILLKQFNVETDRIQNEQILELISFLMFGLFILLLLHRSNK